MQKLNLSVKKKKCIVSIFEGEFVPIVLYGNETMALNLKMRKAD